MNILFYSANAVAVKIFMWLSRLLDKDRMVIFGVHASILTLMLLIALFINATVRGPVALPDNFFKSQFSLSVVINLSFFYVIYAYLNLAREKVKGLSFVAGLLALLITAIACTVYRDLAVVKQSQSVDIQLVRYFIVINTVSKFYYVLCAIVTTALVTLLIQKRHYNQLRLATAQAELAIIKAQTNPHFLFNVLNTLYASAYKFGDYTTANGIGQMSSLMRYTLHSNQQENVTLAQEVEYIEQFISLQQLRFGNKINVDFQCDEIDLNRQLSPMLLMPLIENAFKYGITSGKMSYISIVLATGSDEFSCIVTNLDSSELVKESAHFCESGTGIDNLRQRLELRYPHQYTLQNGRESGNYIARLMIKCC